MLGGGESAMSREGTSKSGGGGGSGRGTSSPVTAAAGYLCLESREKIGRAHV